MEQKEVRWDNAVEDAGTNRKVQGVPEVGRTSRGVQGVYSEDLRETVQWRRTWLGEYRNE